MQSLSTLLYQIKISCSFVPSVKRIFTFSLESKKKSLEKSLQATQNLVLFANKNYKKQGKCQSNKFCSSHTFEKVHAYLSCCICVYRRTGTLVRKTNITFLQNIFTRCYFIIKLYKYFCYLSQFRIYFLFFVLYLLLTSQSKFLFYKCCCFCIGNFCPFTFYYAICAVFTG